MHWRKILLLFYLIALLVAHEVKFIPEVLIFNGQLEILYIEPLVILLKLQNILS